MMTNENDIEQSLEEMEAEERDLEESLTEEVEGELSGPTAEFKALFDEAKIDDEDSEDEDSEYLDEEGIDPEQLLSASVSEDPDDDSLELSEVGITEEELLAANDSDDGLEMDGIEEGSSLSEAFEAMTEASGEAESEEPEDSPVDQMALVSDDSELGEFESAEIEEKEYIDADAVISIVESMLFSTDKALGIGALRQAFEGTNVKPDQIRRAIEQLQIDYADSKRGISLEEVAGGYQIRTKVDNMTYLRRINKGRPFKLSGPALEVLAIVAYKQPLVKAEVDQIRGVESGHLMRALMDKSLMRFAGKSELPGKPMLYETTKKFLDIFGLRSLKELPSLSEIDELIPEGIGEEEEKEKLSDVTDSMSVDGVTSYSEGEEELTKIAETLQGVDTSTEFFEDEKRRERERRDKERADGIREALDFDEEVSSKDKSWLARYDKKLEEIRLEEEAKAAALADTPETMEEDIVEVSSSDNEEGDIKVEATSTENTENTPLIANAEVEENLSTDFVDESAEIFAETATGVPSEDLMDNEANQVDDSEEIFALESVEEPIDTQAEKLSQAFGELSTAIDAFESEEGVSVDELSEEKESDISEASSENKPEDVEL
ncbi:MAG: SMC-Scp complex subunit ScpB [Bdellovibrionales bacterium]